MAAIDFNETFAPVNETIESKWKSINKIWSKIGFLPQEKFDRTKMLVDALIEYVSECEEDEINLMGKIEKSLDEYKRDVDDLQKKLAVSLDKTGLKDVHNSTPTILDELKFYKTLHRQLVAIKNERKLRFFQLAKEEKQLRDVLKSSPVKIDQNKSTFNEDELDLLDSHVEDLSKLKVERVSLVEKFCSELESLMREYELRLDSTSSLNQLIDPTVRNKVPLSQDNVNKFRLSLEKVKSRAGLLAENIEMVRNEVRNNWEKYGLTNAKLLSLVEGADNSDIPYTQTTLDRLNEEKKRCHEIKMSCIGEYTKKLRDEIQRIWNVLFFSDEDKIDFIQFMDAGLDIVDEEIFEKHERYLDELVEVYWKRIELTKKVKTWKSLWKDYFEFEIKHSDSKRFKEKNYSALKESKLRDKFKLDLVRLEKEMKRDGDIFEEKEGKIFTLNGLNIPRIIEVKKAELEKWRNDCRIERQAQLDSNKKVSTPNNKSSTKSFKSSPSSQKSISKSENLSSSQNSIVKQKHTPSTTSTYKSLPLPTTIPNNQIASPQVATSNNNNQEEKKKQQQQQQQQQHQHLHLQSKKKILGEIQPNSAPSTSKRRSIKNMHEKIKSRRSSSNNENQKPLLLVDRFDCGVDCSSDDGMKSGGGGDGDEVLKNNTPPRIVVQSPDGDVIEEPPLNCFQESQENTNDYSSRSNSVVESGFLSNIQESPPVMNSTPLYL